MQCQVCSKPDLSGMKSQDGDTHLDNLFFDVSFSARPEVFPCLSYTKNNQLDVQKCSGYLRIKPQAKSHSSDKLQGRTRWGAKRYLQGFENSSATALQGWINPDGHPGRFFLDFVKKKRTKKATEFAAGTHFTVVKIPPCFCLKFPRSSQEILNSSWKKNSPVLMVASTTMVQDDNLGAGGWCLLKNGLIHKNCDLTWFNPQKFGFYTV